jgi:two-component sensor histidine kinase
MESIEYVYVIDFDGRVFVHTFEGGFPRALGLELHRHEPKITEYIFDTNHILDVSASLIDGMMAHIHIGMNDTHEQIIYVRNWIIGLSLLLALAGSAIGAIVIRRMTRPLSKMADSMRDFGERKREEEIEFKNGGKEITTLTEAFNRMISDRKQAEEQIKASLKEKETLLREIYHRTKNNMQVIRSMLSLQADKYSNIEVQELVKDTGNRIQAMSLVHQMLYKSKDLSSINVNDYIKELSMIIIQSYKASSQKVSLVFDIENISMLIDTAIPLGLVVNELMLNTLKYAFPGEKKGEVVIKLSRKEFGKLDFTYSDDGIGVSEEFDFRKQDTLGFRIIIGIAEQQMDGIVKFEKTNGVTCHIEFSDSLYRERV